MQTNFTIKSRQLIPTIITSISSADIIVTPLETTLSCISIDFAGHRYNSADATAQPVKRHDVRVKDSTVLCLVG